MRINFAKSSHMRRIVGDYVWDANQSEVEVEDARLCAELLTSPGEAFCVAESEPLKKAAKDEEILELALNGIASLAQLAELDLDGKTALSAGMRKSDKYIESLINRAKQILEV